jgi:hypothetical protein
VDPKRIVLLCRSLARDESLREVLSEGGMTEENWRELGDAVTGELDEGRLSELLDLVDDVAAQVGIDGLTCGVREFRPLSSGVAGYRMVSGFGCPHRRRCGRSEPASASSPTCGVTGAPLAQVRIVSG